MLEFGALPPEVNSSRMYAGAGAGPMIAAASAWHGLAEELSWAASSYGSAITGLTTEAWRGPASVSMATAAASYLTWMQTTAAQCEEAATQVQAGITAYEAAFSMTVPPPVVAANRALLTSLVATNFLGQNTPAIAATEAHYGEMWAQDAAAMYSYAAAASSATVLTPFTAPQQNTNPNGLGGQAAAVGQAEATGAGGTSGNVQQALSSMPKLLDSLSSPLKEVMSELPKEAASEIKSMLPETAGAESAAAGTGSLFPSALALVPNAPLAAAAPIAAAPVSAALGQAETVGKLSVPAVWASAPSAVNAPATALAGTSFNAAPTAVTSRSGMVPPMSGLARARSGSGSGSAVTPRYGRQLVVTG